MSDRSQNGDRPASPRSRGPGPGPGERFRDEGELGRGGVGSVRRVYDMRLRREVAMKIAHPGDGEFLSDQYLVEEAQITGQLDHPHVVPVYDLGGGDGEPPFFTMKLVEGRTLTDVVGPLHGAPYDHREIERVLQIFLKACDAISFAHSRGVVHRDLKPDNVMVGSHGQVYVMDWGLALLVGEGHGACAQRVTSSSGLTDADAERPGAVVGTLEYMAPEQAWGRADEIDARTDVFGLGGILYFLLTGKDPHTAATAFDALQLAQRGAPVPPESAAAWPEVPPGLCRIAAKALARSKGDRYESVEALREDVEDFLRGGGWFETATYPAGAAIVTEGEPAKAAYVIVSGSCEVWKGSAEARTLLRVMHADEVFGETAVLTGEPRTATVVAATEVTVKVVTREALERELGQTTWAGAFVRTLAARFRDADAQLAALRDRIRRGS